MLDRQQIESGCLTKSQANSRRKWLESVQQTVVAGLGETTASRQRSSQWLVKDEFLLKCTILDPRYKRFGWRAGLEGRLPPIEPGVLPRLQEELIAEAVVLASEYLLASVHKLWYFPHLGL